MRENVGPFAPETLLPGFSTASLATEQGDMTLIRNVLIGILWFIFLSGSYMGWAALGVLAKLDKAGMYTPAEIGGWIGAATFPGFPVVPLLVVGLGFWFGLLPGFKRSSAAAS